jgi:hypothetical protein
MNPMMSNVNEENGSAEELGSKYFILCIVKTGERTLYNTKQNFSKNIENFIIKLDSKFKEPAQSTEPVLYYRV